MFVPTVPAWIANCRCCDFFSFPGQLGRADDETLRKCAAKQLAFGQLTQNVFQLTLKVWEKPSANLSDQELGRSVVSKRSAVPLRCEGVI